MKKIEDYIEIALEDLELNKQVPFNLFLYFKSNDHIILWQKNGELITNVFIEKYIQKGLKRIWIHKDDNPLYVKYKNKTESEKSSEETDLISEFFNNRTLTSEEQKTLLSATAKELLSQNAAATTPESQEIVRYKNKKIISSILRDLSEDNKSIYDIWELSMIYPELEHGVNVSTYTIMFTLAFGHIDKNLLSDLASAALLHDLGLTKIPLNSLQKSWRQQSEKEKEDYEKHVQWSTILADRYVENISPRVKKLISQHHERFDGHGYPQKLKEVQFDDLAQIISLADLIESYSSGRVDGLKRNFQDSLKTIKEEQEKTSHFSISPEVFNVIYEWVQSSFSEKAYGFIQKTVHTELNKIIEN